MNSNKLLELFVNIPDTLLDYKYITHHNEYQEQMLTIYYEYIRYLKAKQSLCENYKLEDNFVSDIPIDILDILNINIALMHQTYISSHIYTYIPPHNLNFPHICNIIFNVTHDIICIDINFPDVIIDILISYLILPSNSNESWKHVIYCLFGTYFQYGI